MMLTYAAAHDLLEAFGHARTTYDGDAFTALFADVLAAADGVAIADIWAGRDPDTTIASAAGLAEAVARRAPRIPVAAPGSVEDTARWLAGEVRTGDVVLIMGGGRSYRIGELLLEHLEAG